MGGRHRPSWTALALAVGALSVVAGFSALLTPAGSPADAPRAGALISGASPAGPSAAWVPKASPLPAADPGAMGRAVPWSAPPASLAGGLPASEIFYPNAHLDPALNSRGMVVPSLRGVPAPMGVADLGEAAAGAYAYQTKAFEGTIAFQSFQAFEPGYVASPPFQAPDWALVQLNAVAVNVSLPGGTVGTFWVQNAVHLNGSRLQFEDNIWNFSAAGATLPSSTLHGTAGKIYRGFYAGFAPSQAVTFPFTLTLFDSVVKLSTHDVVYCNYTIVNSLGGSQSGTFDTVTFAGTASAATPVGFKVDGSAFTPSNMLYDAELVIGGNGGGGHTNILKLNATAQLRAWSTTSTAYLPVRAAYDFGPDSSETAYGVASHYLNKTGGPRATAYLVQGPSEVYGLWNTSSAAGIAPAAKSGWVNVRLTTNPSYAFVFTNLSSPAGYSYAPSGATGTMTTELPPPPSAAPYVFDAWADGYLPSSNIQVTGNTTGTQAINLVASPTTLNAPVYLDGDAQAAALGAAHASGMGYASARSTLWLNTSQVRLAAPFLSLNVEGNPTFQLFVEQGLSTNVVINGFEQNPATFSYTYYSGAARNYPGWTQGYFFFGGTGRFHVGNTTLEAVPSLTSQTIPAFPAPTVEFYFTHGSSADHLASSNDALAVTAFGASSLSLSDLAVTSGAQGVVATNSTGLTLSGVSASGLDPYFLPSVGVSLTNVRQTTITSLSAADLAHGLVSSGSTSLDLTGVGVATGATGVTVSASSPANISWFNVTGGLASSAGNWTGSHNLAFKHVTVSGTGFGLLNDLYVTMVNSTATGPGSAVVQAFNGSDQGKFWGVNVSDGATGLNLTSASNLTVSTVTALVKSIGVAVVHSTTATVSNVLSATNSTGVFWNVSSDGTISKVSASDRSLGVWAEDATNLAINGVTATNVSLGRGSYFTGPSSSVSYPVAAVALLDDASVSVTNVQATKYPFVVWANGTQGLTVSNVVGWYCGTVISMFENLTNPAHSEIHQVFSFGSRLGALLINCTYVRVDTSTFESSQGFGLNISNGTSNNITLNNFVGNNNSSVTGAYSAAHAQAWTNRKVNTFYENYWADWAHIGTYPVNKSEDKKPLSTGFYSFYLEFTESGLVPGQSWTVALNDYPAYTTTATAVYLPGWSLTSGTLPFKVLAPTDIAANPRYGNVSWTGVTLPAIHIVFGTPAHPLTILGLEAWVFVTIVAVVAAVAVGTFFFLRRRRPRRLRPTTNPLDEPFP